VGGVGGRDEDDGLITDDGGDVLTAGLGTEP